MVVTLVATVAAFRNPSIKARWMFEPRAVLGEMQYERMFTSGLIHADWRHFGMNMFSLYAFGNRIEVIFGPSTMLLIYWCSILGGSALSLFLHRHHEYRALGASGGVCGILFASIFLIPGGSVMVFPLPVPIPAFLFAVLFLAGSYVAHRRGADNIGHDAHLGGAVTGLLVATALYSQQVLASPRMFATVLGLSAVILWLIAFRRFQLPRWIKARTEAIPRGGRARDYAENRARNIRAARLDELLDRVSKGGIHSLSPADREELEKLSREI